MTSNRRRLLIALPLALLLAAGMYAWFTPMGTGEYADSPDKRFRASAENLSRGTWFHGRIAYVGIEVTDTTTHRVVWKGERHRLPGETPPAFGDRQKTFIQWAPDSRSVSIPVGDATPAVWAVN